MYENLFFKLIIAADCKTISLILSSRFLQLSSTQSYVPIVEGFNGEVEPSH